MRGHGSASDKILFPLLASRRSRLRVEVLSAGAMGGCAFARRKSVQVQCVRAGRRVRGVAGEQREPRDGLVGAFVTERESQTDALTVPHSACCAAEPGSLPGIVSIDDSR